MSSSAEQIRAWQGPALLSYGFRPFFLGGALWSALAMVVWIGLLSGTVTLPTAFDPVSWHAHEFLFGYLAAIAAGFLLTAVPNWTGRLPIVGAPLGVLVGLWLAGRLAIAVSAHLPPALVAVLDLAMPVVLAAAIAREICKGRNWRNLLVLAMLLVLIAGNAVFHWEAQAGAYAADGLGLRIGLAASVMMIAVIGGRIVPSFTRNWLLKRGESRLPAPFARFDKLALAALLLALVLWAAAPESRLAGTALVFAGLAQAARLARWAGHRTGAEPLVWVLHLGYAFVPLGAVVLGLAALVPLAVSAPAAQHLWMAGGIGLMTLAVMTRATLGHTGRALTAGPGTAALYLLLIGAVTARLGAGLFPGIGQGLHLLSGLCWIGAFGGFVALYGPLLLRARQGA